MNEKGRQTKLLAAIAVLAMVVCAFAVVMPSENVSGDAASTTPGTIDYGTAVDMNQESWNDLIGEETSVVLDKNTTWNLTGNVTEDNVIIDLNGYNLKITGKYTFTATFADASKLGAVIMSNNSERAANLCIDGSTVNLIGSGDRTDGAWTVDAMNIRFFTITNGAVVDISKKDASAVGTIYHSDTSSASSLPQVAGNSNVIVINDSKLSFSNSGSSVSGVQNVAIIADNSTISADELNGGSFCAYVNLTDSKLSGDKIGLYSAKLTGTSSITATESLGIYTNTNSSAYQGFETGVVELGEGTSITSNDKIVNGLTSGSGVGEKSAIVTGSGTIAGAFTATDKGAAYDFKLIGVTIGASTIAASTDVYLENFKLAGAVTNNGVITIPTGSSVDLDGNTVGGTIYNLSGYQIDNSTTKLPGGVKEASTGSAVVDLINVGYSDIKLNADVTIPAGSNLVIGSDDTLDLNGKTMTIADGDNFTINGDIDAAIGSAIAISGESVVSISTTLDSAAEELTIYTDAEKSNSIKFTKLVGGNFSVRVGSVDAGGNIELEDDGNATVTGEFTVTEDTTIDGTLTFADSAKLTIREGVTLTVKAIAEGSNNVISLYGALTGSGETPLDLNGITISVYSTGSLNKTTGGTIKYTTEDSQFEFKGKMDQNITVSTEQSLTGDLYIPTGYTLTIASGGILNMAGYGIYVEGTLAINANGAIKDFGTAGGAYGNQIILWRNGEIQNSGVIGSGCEVTVTAVIPANATTTTTSPVISVPAGYTGAGSVTLRDVSGISFDVVRGSTSGNTTTYNLGISGNVSIYGMGSYNTVEANDVKITDDLSIGTDVTFTATGVEVQRNVEVTVTGDLNATGGFTMVNGSTVVIYGKVDGDITAQTGTFGVNGSATGTSKITLKNPYTPSGGNPTDVYVTNVVLTVGQYNYVDKDDNAMTDQRLYVSGTVGYVGDATAGGKISIVNNNGLAYVPEGATLALGNIALDGNGLTVLGQIQYTTNANVKNVNGTQYSITDAADKSKVNYYFTTFDAAYDIIDTVDKKTLTVYGGHTVKGQLDLASGQSIIVSGGQFNVAEEGTVDIRNGASITTSSQGAVQKVEGVLTVYSGGVCPQPKEFAVKKTGTDFIQYSGLIPALNNAQSGDVIDVVNNATLENSLTINEGVTVNIDEDVVMTFEEDLTIAVGATLNNDGTIKMTGDKSTITVNGTLNSYDEAVITFVDENDAAVTDNSDGGERAIYSTGTTVVDNTTGIISFINAAYYTNEDNYIVLTSFASANNAVAAQDAYKTITLNGAFTERADVTIAADTNVVVAQDAKVTLGNITLPAADTVAQTLTVNGTLTATVIGATGAADATSEASVALDRASGIKFTVKTNTVGSGATTAYMFIGGAVNGNVTIASGTVYADVDDENYLSVNGDKNSLTVAQGATLAVEKVGNDVASILVGSYDGKAVMTVDGTIAFNGGSLDFPAGATQILDVNGTMTVGDETNVTVDGTLNIAGTLDVSTTADKVGTLSVNGVLVVGTKPTTVGAGTGVVTGAIDTNGTSGYIKAYAGADLTGALIDYVMGESNAESTAFVINGWTYMTIYAEGGVDYTDVIGTTTNNIEKFELAGFLTVVEGTNGYNINDIANWYTDAELIQSASDAVIGTDETLYFKVNSAMVPVTISVGEGISLYIDGIRYQAGTYLSVGTHTVSATVNPGFKGDVTIQFCGQTVTDSFTITPEMASNAYEGVISVSASGNITQDSTVVIDGGSSSDSGMGLTDYLLIILVILIVVMAIIVALRLMRS